MSKAQIQEYQAVVLACHTAARMLAQYDLGELLRDIDRAEGLGPILDPTLYREKRQAMQEDKEIVEAALPLWKFGRRIGPKAQP